MNGVLRARIAHYNERYLERAEDQLASHAGGPEVLADLEARISAPVENFQELVDQYRALYRLGAICRDAARELEDYSEMTYYSERDETGVSHLRREESCHITVAEFLDEHFAYVRALYGESILNF